MSHEVVHKAVNKDKRAKPLCRMIGRAANHWKLTWDWLEVTCRTCLKVKEKVSDDQG